MVQNGNDENLSESHGIDELAEGDENGSNSDTEGKTIFACFYLTNKMKM